MSIKNIYITLAFISFQSIAFSQSCLWTLKGRITDESTAEPLEFATVFITELQRGDAADENGNFAIKNICPGNYHLQISHIGCEGQQLYIKMRRDTLLQIALHHHTEILNEVSIHGTHEQSTVQTLQSISKDDILKNASKNLSDILEKLSGVSVLKNGSGISKPIINGMYGNRITILNNGLVQAGQQWGNDHAPEIDPFLSDHISVIKGCASLAYGGNGLGSIVMIENSPIEEDPHLHGLVNYVYQTNGRGHTFNAKMQQFNDQLSWKIAGTLKKSGDTHAPDYYLSNTGKNEWNLGVQVHKKFSPEWSTDLQASSFNTNIGILRGSHIGNVTDLEQALTREEPFYTTDQFTYHIQAPRQEVNHELIKIENKWQKNDRLIFQFNYGGQLNNRKEYDVRRGDRSTIPALSLKQFSHFFEALMHKEYSHENHLKSGIQFNITTNKNNPGTGTLPLIPDYISARTGSYLILEGLNNKINYEAGVRMDYNHLYAPTISRTYPRTIEKYTHDFFNINLAGGAKYNISEDFKIALNTGYVVRSPEINELYSNGLHQGVSGIEEGNPDLKKEKSFKTILSNELKVNTKFYLQAQLYYQHIRDYIYLKPEKELRLTVRGAFPVYTYNQTNANLSGLDLQASYEPSNHLKWIVKYSYLNGRDSKNQQGLIYMPANTVSNQIQYDFTEGKVFKNTNISFTYKNVFRQNNIDLSQDFLPPPDGYSLANLELNTNINSRVKCTISVENLFNTRYRDYLDRLRYFADEIGRNVGIRLAYSF